MSQAQQQPQPQQPQPQDNNIFDANQDDDSTAKILRVQFRFGLFPDALGAPTEQDMVGAMCQTQAYFTYLLQPDTVETKLYDMDWSFDRSFATRTEPLHVDFTIGFIDDRLSIDVNDRYQQKLVRALKVLTTGDVRIFVREWLWRSPPEGDNFMTSVLTWNFDTWLGLQGDLEEPEDADRVVYNRIDTLVCEDDTTEDTTDDGTSLEEEPEGDSDGQNETSPVNVTDIEEPPDNDTTFPANATDDAFNETTTENDTDGSSNDNITDTGIYNITNNDTDLVDLVITDEDEPLHNQSVTEDDDNNATTTMAPTELNWTATNDTITNLTATNITNNLTDTTNNLTDTTNDTEDYSDWPFNPTSPVVLPMPDISIIFIFDPLPEKAPTKDELSTVLCQVNQYFTDRLQRELGMRTIAAKAVYINYRLEEQPVPGVVADFSLYTRHVHNWTQLKDQPVYDAIQLTDEDLEDLVLDHVWQVPNDQYFRDTKLLKYQSFRGRTLVRVAAMNQALGCGTITLAPTSSPMPTQSPTASSPVPSGVPSMAPTATPTILISVPFLVSNLNNIQSPAEIRAGGLDVTFVKLAERIVYEQQEQKQQQQMAAGSAEETRESPPQRQRRRMATATLAAAHRQLMVTLVLDSIEIVSLVNTTCPEGSLDGLVCHNAIGVYELLPSIDDKNATNVQAQYTEATRNAILDGTAQTILESEFPETPYYIGAVTSLEQVPPGTFEKANYNPKTSNGLFQIGTFSVQIWMVIVASIVVLLFLCCIAVLIWRCCCTPKDKVEDNQFEEYDETRTFDEPMVVVVDQNNISADADEWDDDSRPILP